MNNVGSITRIPPYPQTKLIPGLSNDSVVNNNEMANIGIAQNKNLLSFLKNGNAMINAANGSKKN